MYRDSTKARILAASLVALLCLFSAGSAWAIVDDYVGRDTMPLGASIDGAAVDGLARSAATQVVDEQVKGPLLAPATARFRDRSFTIDPAAYVHVDIDGMLESS